jgi:hypothetical protein
LALSFHSASHPTVKLPAGQKDVQSLLMNEERRPGDEPGTLVVEQVLFEMTFSTYQWRRLRRKKVVRMAEQPQPSV